MNEAAASEYIPILLAIACSIATLISTQYIGIAQPIVNIVNETALIRVE